MKINDGSTRTRRSTISLLSSSSSLSACTHSTTQTMPKFSSDNPIHSVYLKTKGVERLLKRNEDDGTLSSRFVDETRQRIEDNHLAGMPVVREIDEIEEARYDEESVGGNDEPQQRFITLKSSYSSLSSKPSVSWSLPGLEEEEIDPTFLNENYYQDKHRRQLQIAKIKDYHILKNNNAADDQSDTADSVDTFDLFLHHISCHRDDRVTFKDWVRCF